jgi:hypothetical protein
LIHDAAGQVLCPVCGHAGSFDKHCFDERGGVIGSGTCPCCLYEPGFDDDSGASASAKTTPLESIEHYRAMWIEEGMHWRSDRLQSPAGWDGTGQLAKLLKLVPRLE